MKKSEQKKHLIDMMIGDEELGLYKNDVICSACGGYGYTIEVEAECCGNYKEYGCCGVPNPVQVQVQCKCDNGYVRSEHCL
jgi:hypothetical protein